jgi:hypothetical protein
MTDFRTDFTMTIAGRGATSGTTFPVFNPATQRTIARVPHADESQLDEAVAAARKAFASWRLSSMAVRAEVLNAISDVIELNAPALMSLLTEEQGKPRGGAEWEIMGSAFWCREIASVGQGHGRGAENRPPTRCRHRVAERSSPILAASGVRRSQRIGHRMRKFPTRTHGIHQLAYHHAQQESDYLTERSYLPQTTRLVAARPARQSINPCSNTAPIRCRASSVELPMCGSMNTFGSEK